MKTTEATARKREVRLCVGDFETTVEEDTRAQTETEVWAAGFCELGEGKEVQIFHSIEDFLKSVFKYRGNQVIYFHNLKFDGYFILDCLMRNGYKNALTEDGWIKAQDMHVGELKYLISDMGQWYNITVKTGYGLTEFRDSFKLLPFSLETLGKRFGTKHQKSSMEYKGKRYAGCEITPEELDYLKNDVYVLKEAMEICIERGHKRSTIGSCCLSEYQSMVGRSVYKNMYPNQYEEEKENPAYFPWALSFHYVYTALAKDGIKTAGEYCRRAYRGGWCYVNPRYQKINITQHGYTADVNSLYPYVMSGASGNAFPVFWPEYFPGDYQITEHWEQFKQKQEYLFIRFKCHFDLKPGKLPFVQIKNSFFYKGTEHLTTSDFQDFKTGKTHRWLLNEETGERIESVIELVMTAPDFELFLEHYAVSSFSITDYLVYPAKIGIFDEYIQKYREQKTHAENKAERQLAKLYLNNLYGKFAASTDSSFKTVEYNPESGLLDFSTHAENKKAPGYIPIGAAITSYARCYTIRAAQANFENFAYSDTDSIHLIGDPKDAQGIELHDTEFGKWKIENEWDTARYERQKTYLEHTVKEDGEAVDPYWIIKCAGMPQKCKDIFRRGLGDTIPESVVEKWNESEREESLKTRTIDDFRIGLTLPGKLSPRRVHGGIVLTDCNFTMSET